MGKNKNDSVALFAIGTTIFGIGLFFSYGIGIFFGAVMMIAGMLPPSGDKNDPV